MVAVTTTQERTAQSNQWPKVHVPLTPRFVMVIAERLRTTARSACFRFAVQIRLVTARNAPAQALRTDFSSHEHEDRRKPKTRKPIQTRRLGKFGLPLDASRFRIL